MWVAEADGCKAGWFRVARESGALCFRLVESAWANANAVAVSARGCNRSANADRLLRLR